MLENRQFFFPALTPPHLHIASSPVNNRLNPPWRLAYLGFTDVNGYRTVIYQRWVRLFPGKDL